MQLLLCRYTPNPQLECGVVTIPEQSDFSTDEIDPGYFPFVSDGYVSLVGSEKKVSVKISRREIQGPWIPLF